MIAIYPAGVGARGVAPEIVDGADATGREESYPCDPATLRSLREHGFTLLELLVAMTVFALLLLLLYNGLSVVARTSRTVETRAEALDETTAVHRLLQREFAQFQPVAMKDEQGQPVPTFSGNARSVRWLAPLPVHRGGHGLYWIVVSLAATSSGGNLGLDYVPRDVETAAARDEMAPADTRVVLLSDLERFECRYLRAGKGDSAPEWLTEWNATEESPIAVRMIVKRRIDPEQSEWLFPVHARQVAPSQNTTDLPEESGL